MDNQYFKLSPHEIEVYEKQRAAEPAITSMLEKISEEIGMPLFGLEYRLKTAKSLSEKLYDRGEMEEIDGIRDIVRYTFVAEDDKDYIQLTAKVLAAISENAANYNIKNYWMNEANPYQGINTSFTSKEGIPFEVQFHTKDSVHIKETKSHALYEEIRILDIKNHPENKKKADRLNKQLKAVWGTVPIPNEIELIETKKIDNRKKDLDNLNDVCIIELGDSLDENGINNIKTKLETAQVVFDLDESSKTLIIPDSINNVFVLNAIEPYQKMHAFPFATYECAEQVCDICRENNIAASIIFDKKNNTLNVKMPTSDIKRIAPKIMEVVKDEKATIQKK